MVAEAYLCVNNFPKVVILQRKGRESNPRPFSHWRRGVIPTLGFIWRRGLRNKPGTQNKPQITRIPRRQWVRWVLAVIKLLRRVAYCQIIPLKYMRNWTSTKKSESCLPGSRSSWWNEFVERRAEITCMKWHDELETDGWRQCWERTTQQSDKLKCIREHDATKTDWGEVAELKQEIDKKTVLLACVEM